VLEERALSEIQGEDPMIVVLAREAYSAKDQVQNEGYSQLSCDRHAIGPSGDTGGFGAHFPLAARRGLRIAAATTVERARLCRALPLRAEGEGFEPSTRLYDV
jgi:hypothetical protein